jgi:hypothetical protein
VPADVVRGRQHVRHMSHHLRPTGRPTGALLPPDLAEQGLEGLAREAAGMAVAREERGRFGDGGRRQVQATPVHRTRGVNDALERCVPRHSCRTGHTDTPP